MILKAYSSYWLAIILFCHHQSNHVSPISEPAQCADSSVLLNGVHSGKPSIVADCRDCTHAEKSMMGHLESQCKAVVRP